MEKADRWRLVARRIVGRLRWKDRGEAEGVTDARLISTRSGEAASSMGCIGKEEMYFDCIRARIGNTNTSSPLTPPGKVKTTLKSIGMQGEDLICLVYLSRIQTPGIDDYIARV